MKLRYTLLMAALVGGQLALAPAQAQTEEKTPGVATKQEAPKDNGTIRRRNTDVQRPDAAQVNKPAASTTQPTVNKPKQNQGGPVGKAEKRQDVASLPEAPSTAAQEAAQEAKLPKSAATKARDVVEQVGPGKVNWTKQVVEVTGMSVIDNERFKNKAQARLMAIRGAYSDGYRNLLATLKGVEVTSETTVEDMMTTSDFVQTRIQGVVKGAKVIGKPREDDGAMVVTMQVELYGTKGVAGAVYDYLNQVPTDAHTEETHSSSETPSGGAADMAKTAELGQGITPEIAKSLQGSAPGPGEKPVAFNLTGGKLNPQMFPVFVDDKGQVVLNTKVLYDPTKGEFPQWLQMGKDIMNSVGYKKGADVIDVVQNSKGEFVLPKLEGTWGKVADWAGRIGKTLLMFTPLGNLLK